MLAQEKSTWFSPFTSGTIRSSSTSVALALSSWISTRSRTGSVISFTRANAAAGKARFRVPDCRGHRAGQQQPLGCKPLAHTNTPEWNGCAGEKRHGEISPAGD